MDLVCVFRKSFFLFLLLQLIIFFPGPIYLNHARRSRIGEFRTFDQPIHGNGLSNRNADTDKLVKSNLMKEPDLSGNIQTQLVYSTPNSLYSSRISGLTDDKISLKNFQLVHSEKGYFIDTFDLSVQDNLIIIAKKTLHSIPMSGTNENFLGIKGKKQISGIEVTDGAFVVDWKDRNIYVFHDKKIVMHQLIRTHIKRDIYSATEVSNMLIDQNNNIIAWINNKNNIMKGQKDGSNILTIITESTPIECMHFDPVSMRFFYIVKTMMAGVVYSIDYDAQQQRNREASFSGSSENSEIRSMAKYSDFVYYINKMQGEVSISYQLCRLKLKSNKDVDILVNTKKAITSLRLIYQYKQTNLCINTTSNRCSYMCVHIQTNAVACVCPNTIQVCTMPTTQKLTTISTKITTPTPSPNIDSKMPLIWIIVGVALPICVGLISYAAYIYLYDDRGDSDKSSSSDSSQDGANSDGKSDNKNNSQIDSKVNSDSKIGDNGSAISSGTGISSPNDSIVGNLFKKSKEIFENTKNKISKTLSISKKGKDKKSKSKKKKRQDKELHRSESGNSLKAHRGKKRVIASDHDDLKHELTDSQKQKILKDKERLEILEKKLKLDELKRPKKVVIKGGGNELCEVIGKIERTDTKKRKHRRRTKAETTDEKENVEKSGDKSGKKDNDKSEKKAKKVIGKKEDAEKSDKKKDDERSIIEMKDENVQNFHKESRLAKRTEELRKMDF